MSRKAIVGESTTHMFIRKNACFNGVAPVKSYAAPSSISVPMTKSPGIEAK
jgi:hypothetical protein